MATFRVAGYNDGPRIALNSLIKNPLMIRSLVYQSFANSQFFIMDMLRDSGHTDTGQFGYQPGNPFFMNESPAVRADGAEIALGTMSVNTPVAGYTTELALGFEISERDVRANNYNKVGEYITRLHNTFERDWNARFLTSLLGAAPTMVSSSHLTTGGWAAGDNTTAGKQFIRTDLSNAEQIVNLADYSTNNGTGNDKFGFVPTDLVLHPVDVARIIQSRELTAQFLGQAATQNEVFSNQAVGVKQLPGNIFGLKPWSSWQMTQGQALVLQREAVGGVVDEIPLTTTPMYQIMQRKVWRSDTNQSMGVFIDNPKASLLITNIDGS